MEEKSKAQRKMPRMGTDGIHAIRKYIQRTQIILLLAVTLLMSAGGAFINIAATERDFDAELQNTASLITRLYQFTKDYPKDELCAYMDGVAASLSDVDVISIVGSDRRRIYHTNHALIGTIYDGNIPDFTAHEAESYLEDEMGPSGPQRRIYSAVPSLNKTEAGFIMTIRLKRSMKRIMQRTLALFFTVIAGAVLLELVIAGILSKRIKKEFLLFTEDFEGTKILVDSMRANNHDFTNKLHVISGLIQIGEYDKAVSYIQNISMIQKETISRVMNSIDNPAFAALIVGKIARASECDVRFVLTEQSRYRSEHVELPSEALVTITGNLIDNALDAMNTSVGLGQGEVRGAGELILGIYTKPSSLLITVKDSGPGIVPEARERIFERGFSTKGGTHGIGLFHVKQLVEGLGGKISFESEIGKGTCFMVCIGQQNP